MALFLMFISDSFFSIIKVWETKIPEERKPQLHRCENHKTGASIWSSVGVIKNITPPGPR
jgi:hypothetical protein